MEGVSLTVNCDHCGLGLEVAVKHISEDDYRPFLYTVRLPPGWWCVVRGMVTTNYTFGSNPVFCENCISRGVADTWDTCACGSPLAWLNDTIDDLLSQVKVCVSCECERARRAIEGLY